MTATTTTPMSSAACRTGGRTSRVPCRRSASHRFRTRRTDSAMSATMMRRFAMISTEMMIARRRKNRSRAPGVHDDVVLHDHRLRGRFNARTVAMRADRRTIRMGDDLRPVADCAEGTVNVTAIHPCPSRHTAGCKGEHRSCQNCPEVLVHSTPHFPFYTRQGAADGKI